MESGEEQIKQIERLERQVTHFRATLEAILNAYAHKTDAGEGCQCAACVAERAVKVWEN